MPSQHVYQVMKRIHEFDAAPHGRLSNLVRMISGVYFIQKDASNRLIPCSPNKLFFSDGVSIRPGRRLVLSGFQTVYKSHGGKNLERLGRSDQESGRAHSQDPVEIDIAEGD